MYESGRPIRGGVPVIFPWFGTGPQGSLKPAHGFGRIIRWIRTGSEETVGVDGSLVAEYELDDRVVAPQPDFPYAFKARLRATFSQEYLQIDLEIHNASDVSFTFEEALHTYIAVGNVRQVSIQGLDTLSYLDRAPGAPTLECVQEGPVTISSETDRVYAHDGSLVLDDPVWGRKLEISKRGSANTVVWNPWVAKSATMPDFGDDEWSQMLCIETGNVLDDAITLAPNETHMMQQRISLVGVA